jgi:hypothetical protein
MSNLTQTIQRLYSNYRAFLPDVYRWEDEQDRWAELVFCLFRELTALMTQPLDASSVLLPPSICWIRLQP